MIEVLQGSYAEQLLIENNIEYSHMECENKNRYWFSDTCLIVNGVPLDYHRAVKWIKERVGNE